MSLGQYSKSIATLVVGVQGWGLMVVRSSSPAVTSGEWMALVAVAVTFVLVFLVPNAPASVAAPQALPPHEGIDVPADTVGLGVTGGSWTPSVAIDVGVPSRAAQP